MALMALAAVCIIPALAIDRVVKYARQTEHGILVALAVLVVVVGVKAWRRRKRIHAATARSQSQGAE